jgi:5-methylcytosine-specific restriction endonuclease McrA
MKPRSAKKQVTADWSNKFLEKIKGTHKRNLAKVVTRIMKRTTTVKSSLVTRSKKYNVECNVTVDELRQLMFDSYGTKCKYCDKILKIDNMVFDHIVPISKQGTSNIDNLQIICRTSNGMKGSLTEETFDILLEWLKTVPDELSRDIRIRLSKGIN